MVRGKRYDHKGDVGEAKQQGRTALNEVESKDVLKTIGIPTTETRLATSRGEAVAFAKAIGFPVVLKIVSPDVLHKSDSGGVKLSINSEEEVKQAYDEILTSVKKAVPSAKIEGVSVQNMARSGLEVIIGLSKDPQFGPVLMFGIGGILVEIMKDVAFRIVPLTRRDAREMIREIKGYPLLEGYRGMEPANVPLLEEMILKVSNFADENPEVREMDLNPIYAYRDGALAVDARIILD
ncbi:MAG: acetate--CoA ligase family protein [Candidatus Tectomicrobia bacterium]|nr:acetate--CoA ligase family protein [Candidatus Tectomicrobia bacterium]